jgi:hypothetical protein
MAEARRVALEVLAEDPELRNPAHELMRDYVSKNAARQELSAG